MWKVAGAFQRLPTTHSLSKLSFIPWQLEGPHSSGQRALHATQTLGNQVCSQLKRHDAQSVSCTKRDSPRSAREAVKVFPGTCKPTWSWREHKAAWLPPLKGSCQISGTPRHGQRELCNSNLFSKTFSSSQAQERISEAWKGGAPAHPACLQPPVVPLPPPASTLSWTTGQLCTTLQVTHLSRSARGPTTSPKLRTPRDGTTQQLSKLSCPPTAQRRAKRHGERDLGNTPHLPNLSGWSRYATSP